MNDNPLVSIIVPVYNGEKYLRECLDSILRQSYSNIELILIDDGSQDSSAAICDEYGRNERVTVVHKANGGQASARNDGLDMAKGDIIGFVDCDDWLEPHMTERMVSLMAKHDAEVAICGFVEEYEGRSKGINTDSSLSVIDAEDAVKEVLRGHIGSYLWSMYFRREVIRERIPDMRCYEDHAVIFKWISHAQKVVVAKEPLYHYRQLPTSSLHSYDPRKGNDFFMAISERYHYVIDHDLLPGWEKENRRLYIRGCIKLTKDLARMPNYDKEMHSLICRVRDELKTFLPVGCGEIGLKYFVRLRLLLINVDVFVGILRSSKVFSLANRRR